MLAESDSMFPSGTMLSFGTGGSPSRTVVREP
jgi:hypothetical protein